MRMTFLAAVLLAASAGTASAQSFVYVGPRTVANNVAVLPHGNYSVPSYGAPRIIGTGTYFPAYGYPSAPYPLPARFYAGFGTNDFPFHGQPYGSPSEPWNWEGLGRYSAHPPVRVTGVVLP